MKKIAGFLILCAFFFIMSTSMSSCSRKTGCPVNEDTHQKVGKNGLPSSKKKSKSNLFPKEMRKKKKKS